MKRFLLSIVLATILAFTSCQFDDSEIWDKFGEIEDSIRDHEQRISALEELCKQMNTNIEALQTIVEALEKRDYITNVSEVRSNGEVIGYTISFANSDTVTIYHGQDGKDGLDGATGKDGYTPQIGVMKDTDDFYYWTVDGEWLLDGKGNKIKAAGQDGKDGVDGEDGQNGTNGTNGSNGTDGEDGKDGADGIIPRLKIENDYWYISYDEGKSWEQLGKATGENGKNGIDGTNGSDGKDGENGVIVNVQETTTEVVFILSDGSSIVIPKSSGSVDSDNVIYFSDSVVKSICVANWDTNGDGEISYREANEVYGMDDLFTYNTEIISFNELQYFTNISDACFGGCTNLRSVVLPESVLIVEFGSCSNLTRFNIPENVCFIDMTSCENVRSVIVTAAMSDYFRFMYCYNLESAVLSDGLTTIPHSAFSGCWALTHITIPASVSSIEAYAFHGCNGLRDVYCKATTPPTCGENAFKDDYNNPLNCKIYVPTSSIEAYKTAEGWSEYVDMIEPYDFEN